MHPYDRNFFESLARQTDAVIAEPHPNSFYLRTSGLLLGLGLLSGAHAIAEVVVPERMAVVDTRLEQAGLPEQVLEDSGVPGILLTFIGGAGLCRTVRRINADSAANTLPYDPSVVDYLEPRTVDPTTGHFAGTIIDVEPTTETPVQGPRAIEGS